MPSDLPHRIVGALTAERTVDFVRAALFFFLMAAVARLAGRGMRRVVAVRGDAQRALILGRLTTWILLGVGLAGTLEELGFKLSVVFGAAGVLTVAFGFAAQTTLSNLVSGLFLFGERPFRVGDTIEIDGVSGEVLSIDMMATTLRTTDNRFVRIPNELVIKTKVTNHTRFPLRRLELVVPISPAEDFGAVRALLLQVLDRNSHCLADPAPSVFLAAFGETSVQVSIWAWTRTENLQELRAALGEETHRVLADVKRSSAAIPRVVGNPGDDPEA
jgi:small-conductance mechanosensitive channel